MCRARPVRTCIHTVGPLVFCLAQFLNATVHGTVLWPVVALSLVTCVFSVIVTRYHLSTYRRRRLTAGLDDPVVSGERS